MLVNYNFSIQGKAHKEKDKPCQDFSAVVDISPAWKCIMAADGVGSCKHSEKASEMAVGTAAEIIKKGFPVNGTDRDYQSLLLTAGHCAANAIDNYISENDKGNEKEYHTTLTMALCSKETVYYFCVGDSGIIALNEENGQWQAVTKQDNDSTGGVYTLSFRNRYKVGKLGFKPAAVLAVTDGIYNECFPLALRDEKFKGKVPLLNFFTTFAFGLDGEDAEKAKEEQVKNIIKYLESEECEHLTDDLSISAVINSETCLEEDDIPYESPDWYAVVWKNLGYTPYSEEIRRKQFEDFIRENKPGFSDEEVRKFADSYIKGKTA